jgi:hypothetical protein
MEDSWSIEFYYFIIFQKYLIKNNNHVKLKLFVFHLKTLTKVVPNKLNHDKSIRWNLTIVTSCSTQIKPYTRRKVPIFDWSLRLFSSRWRHLRLKVCVVAFDKLQASLVVGDNGVDKNCSLQILVHDKIRVYVCGANINNYFGYIYGPFDFTHNDYDMWQLV